MTDKRLVLSSTSSREEAQKIAEALVEGRLAACVQIVGPMHSVYRWQGAVEKAEEFLLLMKTTVTSLPRLRNELKSLHSYECRSASKYRLRADCLPTWNGSTRAFADLQAGFFARIVRRM